MLLVDLSHTSHTRANTGIQRLSRSIFAEMERIGPTEGICLDPYRDGWRPLSAEERANLSASARGVRHRGARWSWLPVLRGRLRRALRSGPRDALPAQSAALLVPEIFSPAVAAALPRLLGRIGGPRVALFHDPIPLKYPELTPTKTVARFPAYLQELALFDGVAAISESSRDALKEYWGWLGLGPVPPVVAQPLAVEITGIPDLGPIPEGRPIVLSVGTLEGRKNHLSLLRACEKLWTTGLSFDLELIGLAHPVTGRAALRELAALQASGRPVRYLGSVDEAELHRAYRRCRFTVYPSLLEGFGFPVFESLAHGKPCICSDRGALGEASRGGGCLTAPPEPDSLAAAINRLLVEPEIYQQCVAAARQRRFKSWPEYSQQLLAWMKTLPHRPASEIEALADLFSTRR